MKSRPSTSARTPELIGAVGRLLRPFWPVLLLAGLLGTLSGLATAWLLATINSALHEPGRLAPGLLWRFAGLCALAVGGRAAAGIGNSMVGQRVIAALRKDIAAAMLRVPIATVEDHRPYRLLGVLNGDIDTVSAFTFNVSGYAISLAIVVGGFLYLLLLSPAVCAMVVTAAALGVAINVGAKRGWIRHYEDVRGMQDELQHQYRAITEGAKELRLNAARREHVHAGLLSSAADRIALLKSRAMRLFWFADAAGAAIFFLVIGVLLTLRTQLGITPATISGTVLILLYVRGPIEQVANALPIFDQAQVALRRIAQLSAALIEEREASDETPTDAPPFRRVIALNQARYVFRRSDGGIAFALGPLDLAISRGEIVFVVGENGSGKTTLVKLLLGLYAPTEGKLILDGVAVATEQRSAYRQLFSAVFSDYHLFEDLLDADATTMASATEYLRLLELDRHVAVRDGRFSTTELSTGQRKRLALVHAYLEQRPIMMLDEWAADQDPSFRRVFYDRLLPDLKRQGKTLIVVSHDDRFFGIADRVVRLKDGVIVDDRVPQEIDVREAG